MRQFTAVVLSLFLTTSPVSTCPLFQAPGLYKSKHIVW